MLAHIRRNEEAVCPKRHSIAKMSMEEVLDILCEMSFTKGIAGKLTIEVACFQLYFSFPSIGLIVTRQSAPTQRAGVALIVAMGCPIIYSSALSIYRHPSKSVHFTACGKPANDFSFARSVGRSVGVEDVVKPDGRLFVHVRVLPGVPRQVSLALACDQSPVDGADMMIVSDGEHRIKGAACAACHVLRTDDGAAVRLERLDASFKLFGPAIVVESDDVRLGQLNLDGRAFLGSIRPVALPQATG